mgnify:CR=1 FL=1
MAKRPYKVVTIIFWISAAFLLGLVSVLHGDCLGDTAQIVTNCIGEKQRIGEVCFALSLVIYAIIIGYMWLRSRESR